MDLADMCRRHGSNLQQPQTSCSFSSYETREAKKMGQIITSDALFQTQA